MCAQYKGYQAMTTNVQHIYLGIANGNQISCKLLQNFEFLDRRVAILVSGERDKSAIGFSRKQGKKFDPKNCTKWNVNH